ncbi:hypothetical protein OG302_31480 [Streptomyces sp. NBC_01283]|nr:hypothetical protein OG302_31480 [Streptomyces sp. NBC_01283]
MRLGKALATGIAEEDPREQPRQEAREHADPEPEQNAVAEELAAEAPAAR